MKMLKIQQFNVENVNYYQEIRLLPMPVSNNFQIRNIGRPIFNFMNVITNPFFPQTAKMSPLYKYATLWLVNLIRQVQQES